MRRSNYSYRSSGRRRNRRRKSRRPSKYRVMSRGGISL